MGGGDKGVGQDVAEAVEAGVNGCGSRGVEAVGCGHAHGQAGLENVLHRGDGGLCLRFRFRRKERIAIVSVLLEKQRDFENRVSLLLYSTGTTWMSETESTDVNCWSALSDIMMLVRWLDCAELPFIQYPSRHHSIKSIVRQPSFSTALFGW